MGNSRLKALLWLEGPRGERVDLPGDADVETWERELGPLLAAADAGAALCSVRPERSGALSAWLRQQGVQLSVVEGDSPTPFTVAVRARETLGADRLCNAAAAWDANLAPALVVDAGTALTLDLVDGSGVYRGGAILPGPGLALAALAGGAERLPRVEPRWPALPWGLNSEEALQAGALWGGLAAAEGLARRFRRQFGETAPVILTGGGAPALAGRWQEGARNLEPDWTLRGLAAMVWHSRQ